MATHTSTPKARRKALRNIQVLTASYVSLLKDTFPEDFHGIRRDDYRRPADQDDRERRIEYYSLLASALLPLFDGSPWQRKTTRH